MSAGAGFPSESIAKSDGNLPLFHRFILPHELHSLAYNRDRQFTEKAIVSIHELDCRPLTIDVIGGVLTAETVDVLRTHGDVPKLDGTSTLHRNAC